MKQRVRLPLPDRGGRRLDRQRVPSGQVHGELLRAQSKPRDQEIILVPEGRRHGLQRQHVHHAGRAVAGELPDQPTDRVRDLLSAALPAERLHQGRRRRLHVQLQHRRDRDHDYRDVLLPEQLRRVHHPDRAAGPPPGLDASLEHGHGEAGPARRHGQRPPARRGRRQLLQLLLLQPGQRHPAGAIRPQEVLLLPLHLLGPRAGGLPGHVHDERLADAAAAAPGRRHAPRRDPRRADRRADGQALDDGLAHDRRALRRPRRAPGTSRPRLRTCR